MSNVLTYKEAKEGCEFLGDCMELRYTRFAGRPIQKWPMPPKEKSFFTCWAMNMVLDGDGFQCLIDQPSEDVDAFIKILGRLGAKKTSALVKSTIQALRDKTMNPSDEDKCTFAYYKLVKREKVWPRLLDYTGRPIFMRYFEKAQKLESEGKRLSNPKEWMD